MYIKKLLMISTLFCYVLSTYAMDDHEFESQKGNRNLKNVWNKLWNQVSEFSDKAKENLNKTIQKHSPHQEQQKIEQSTGSLSSESTELNQEAGKLLEADNLFESDGYNLNPVGNTDNSTLSSENASSEVSLPILEKNPEQPLSKNVVDSNVSSLEEIPKNSVTRGRARSPIVIQPKKVAKKPTSWSEACAAHKNKLMIAGAILAVVGVYCLYKFKVIKNVKKYIRKNPDTCTTACLLAFLTAACGYGYYTYTA